MFPVHAKNEPRWAQMGPGGFFPTNPDLADILGRTDFDFENFYFLDFLGPHLGPDLGPAWAQLGPSLGPGLGPAWAQAWAQTPPPAPAPPDEFSDPNLTPLPTHPGMKYFRKETLAVDKKMCIFLHFSSPWDIPKSSKQQKVCTRYPLQASALVPRK